MPKDKQIARRSRRCASVNGSMARTLAVELAKQIEQQDDECEYPHVPTERLESLIEHFLQARRLAPPNVKVSDRRIQPRTHNMPKTNRKPKARADSLERMVRRRQELITHRCLPSWGVTECYKMLWPANGHTVKTSTRWIDVTCPECLKSKPSNDVKVSYE